MGGVLMFRSERMRRTGARSTASGTSSHMKSWADCITGTHESSFWKRHGQYFFDRSELLSARCGRNRTISDQFIIFINVDVLVALFSLKARDLCPYLLWREHAPHPGNEPRQLSRKFGMLGGSTGKIQQLFSDHVIKCRFEPIPELDVLGSVHAPTHHRRRGSCDTRPRAPLQDDHHYGPISPRRRKAQYRYLISAQCRSGWAAARRLQRIHLMSVFPQDPHDSLPPVFAFTCATVRTERTP